MIIISLGCKKPVGDSHFEPNKYLFRDTISLIQDEPQYYPALNIGLGPGPIANTFSYDLWVKPTRNIIMVDEGNSCSYDGTSSLANSDQNWVIIPRLFNSPDFGTGLGIGTNGLIFAEFSTYKLAGLKSFARGLMADLVAVENGIKMSWSNGAVEGHVNRIKSIKRQMYGRASFELLRRKVILSRAG